jgi:hypothetical protein
VDEERRTSGKRALALVEHRREMAKPYSLLGHQLVLNFSLRHYLRLVALACVQSLALETANSLVTWFAVS